MPVEQRAAPPAHRPGLELLPAVLALALLVVALATNGAYAVHSWAPLCLVVLALLVFSPLRRLRGALLVAAGTFWAFAAWTALSMLWSDASGDAVEGAARAVLYAGLFTVPLVTLPDRRGARRFAILLASALAGVTVLTFILVLARGEDLFLAGRLDAPIGYRNGTASLFVLAFWPLLCVAAAKEVTPLLRCGAFAVGVVALGLSFLTQSRGAFVGFAAGALVVLLVGPDRLRRAWLILAAGGLVAALSGQLLTPYDAFLDGLPAGTGIGEASDALVLLAVIATAGMLFVAIFDRGLRGSSNVHAPVRIAAIAGLVLVIAGGFVGAIVRVGDPVAYVGDRIDEFGELTSSDTTGTRLGSTGGQRQDLWRVAGDELSASPLAGNGEGSYQIAYFRERRTDRNLTDPHSLPLRVAAELGFVGLALLLAFLVAVGVYVARARSLVRPDRRWLAAMTAIGTTFFAQSLVDWLWLIPGVAGFGVLALGAAAALARREPEEHHVAGGRRSLGGPAVRAGWAVAAVAVALFYLSDYEVREARAAGATSAQAQLDAAERAERLNPFALSPRLLQAGALESLGETGEARDELLGALDVEDSFVVRALIGDLEMRAGRRGEALRWYRRALAANPRDVGLQQLASGEAP